MNILGMRLQKVNRTPDPSMLSAELKREARVYRVATILGDVLASCYGDEPKGVSALEAPDRDRFRVITKVLMEIYERRPRVGREERQAGGGLHGHAAGLAPFRETQALIARQQGRDAARQRGHEVGLWRLADDGRDEAVCARCGRSAVIDLDAVPVFSGEALSEGCLWEAQ